MWCWQAPLIPELGNQKQVDFGEFKVTLVYRVSSKWSRLNREAMSQKVKRNLYETGVTYFLNLIK